MLDLLNVLISRGMNRNSARELIQEMKMRIMEGEDPEEVLYEEGLEPDYVLDLLDL